MTHQVHAFARKAIWALPVWAALLFFGNLTHQPDPQTAFDMQVSRVGGRSYRDFSNGTILA